MNGFRNVLNRVGLNKIYFIFNNITVGPCNKPKACCAVRLHLTKLSCTSKL